MAIVFICWAVMATVFALALFRAAARPVPRPEEDILVEPEQLELPAITPPLQVPRPVAKARAQVLASSYTTL